ncbi:putative hexose phosphate transport protein, partial [Tetrabaena socialis]
DKPEDLGFPPVEPVAVKPAAAKDEKPKSDLWESLLNNVLKNPFIWGMALTYFFIYVVRQGVTSWFVFYLIKEKGIEDAAQAAVRVSGLELGGLVGSLVAGRLSDGLIRGANGKGGNVGKRVTVVMWYTVGIAAALLSFQALPAAVPAAIQWANVFMIGFFLYGPQMLIGLCGAELVGPDAVGASEGFLGWIAYLGAANAGIPLSIIVKEYGWNAYFTTLVVACGLAVLLLSPMTKLKSYVQREATRKERLAKAE